MEKVINNKGESIFLDSLKDIVKSARKYAYSSICFAQVQSNWLLGKRIVEQIQKGNDKAEYGKHILKIASESLTEEFGKGYSETNLKSFRKFYLIFKDYSIGQTMSEQLEERKQQTLSAKLEDSKRQAMPAQLENSNLQALPVILSWTHYERDLKVGKITHQDVGQMDMYVRMYDELKKGHDDNPTIGILLCAQTDKDIAKYSILKGNEHIFASKYKLILPTEEELANEIKKQREIYLDSTS